MSKARNKILILVPAFTARGGITNYYQVLKDDFPEEVEYFERGARTWPVRKGTIPELIRAFKDFRQFKMRITEGALGINSIIRDGFFLRYAHKKGIKTIVFFRGWDDRAEAKTQKRYLNLFRYFFFFADAIIVLSERTKATIKKWGYRGEIFTETTLVDKRLIDNVFSATITKKFVELRQNRTLNLLFLSRLEKSKGIYELIEAYKRLRSHATFKFTLSICGDGFELEPLREMIQASNLEDIKVVGFVSGVQKKQAFNNAHVFVFPSHSEGMPNAVLEAMGFGLPVITTPVGGVIDFFGEGKNGYFTSIYNPEELAGKIEKLVSDEQKLTNIANANHQMALERFSSDKVAERIINIFAKVTGKQQHQ